MDTESALQIAREAHVAVDPIPRGMNTYWQIFTTADGKLAALLQQSGFEERETGLGLEVNGTMAVVAFDQAKRISINTCTGHRKKNNHDSTRFCRDCRSLYQDPTLDIRWLFSRDSPRVACARAR
jgi:hypothetical protein